MSVRRRPDTSNERNSSPSRDDLSPLVAAESDPQVELSDSKSDRGNIALLFFLYLLQGIPLGLTQAIPMLLQNRGVSYAQQAEFSFAIFPFSLKLIYAPIVDSLYFSKFGRRKSWLIPTQYLIGVFMIYLSFQVEKWLGDPKQSDSIPNVGFLTSIFFLLNLFAATQDIAVDGWALTMLKRSNVGHASTCNSVGQTAGYFLGYVAFIALESKDFCNTYLRTIPESEGLVTLSQFLWFWGICFLATTTLVALLKSESVEHNNHSKGDDVKESELNVKESYLMLWRIIKMKPIQILVVILLTVKVTFAASDAVSSLKLLEAGVPKEKLALLAIPMIPLQIVLPLVISKYTNGPKPMNVYVKAIPYRLVMATIATGIVYVTPIIISSNNGEVPSYYYIMLIIIYGLYQIGLYSMFVAIMAFFAKISDPAVGGTYMTFLNTICNLGGNWPNTVVLWIVDSLTWKDCIPRSGIENSTKIYNNNCITKIQKDECASNGGNCITLIDGYYIESLICAVYGLIWLYNGKKWIYYLQKLPTKQWLVVKDIKKSKSR